MRVGRWRGGFGGSAGCAGGYRRGLEPERGQARADRRAQHPDARPGLVSHLALTAHLTKTAQGVPEIPVPARKIGHWGHPVPRARAQRGTPHRDHRRVSPRSHFQREKWDVGDTVWRRRDHPRDRRRKVSPTYEKQLRNREFDSRCATMPVPTLRRRSGSRASVASASSGASRTSAPGQARRIRSAHTPRRAPRGRNRATRPAPANLSLC